MKASILAVGRVRLKRLCVGLVISGQVNRLTGKMHLTACYGKIILYRLKKIPQIFIFLSTFYQFCLYFSLSH